MSQLNVGTLNVGTTQFSGDNTTLSTAPATSLAEFMTGTPATNQVVMWNGSAWVPASMGGRFLGMNDIPHRMVLLLVSHHREELELGQNLLDVIMF